MRRLRAILLVLVLTLGYVLATEVPASSACHIVGFTMANYVWDEQSGPAMITVERDGSQGSGSIDYSTSDGTAKVANQDYTGASGTLTFAVGDKVKSFEVSINNDTASESDETVNLHLTPSAVPGCTGTAGLRQAVLTIKDNDSAPPPPAPPAVSPSPSPSPKQSVKPSPSASPSAVASPSPSPSLSVTPEGAIEKSPEASPDAAIAASASPLVKTKGKTGNSKVAIIALIAILVAGGAGFGLWKLRRT